MSSEARTIWRQGRVYALGNAVNRLAGLLLIPVLLHAMSPEEWGAYMLILLAGQFLAIVPGSLADSMDRLYFDHQDEDGRGRVVTTALGLYAALGLLLAALAWPLAWLLGEMLFEGQRHQPALVIACLTVISELYFTLALHYLRLRLRAMLFAVATLGRSLLHFALSILFVVVFQLSVLGVILGQALAVTLTALPLLALMLKAHPWRYHGEDARRLLGLSLPLAPAWSARNAFAFVERSLLDLLAGVSVVGLFSLGSRLADQLRNVITSPFDTIWGVSLLERGEKREEEEAFHRIYVYYLLVCVGAALGLSLYAPEVVRLVALKAPDFWEAWRVVPLLAAVQVLISLNYHFEMCLLQRKAVRYLTLSNGAALAACAALLLVLIPVGGMLGAAFGILLAQGLRLALAVWSAARCSHYPAVFPWSALVVISGTALAAWLAAYLLVGGAVSLEAFLAKTLIFLAFAAAAFFGPAFTAKERRVAFAAVAAPFRSRPGP